MRASKQVVEPELVAIEPAAGILGVGPGKFRRILRERPDVAAEAEVILGPRCKRYRVKVLRQLAATITSVQPKISEPAELAAAREARAS